MSVMTIEKGSLNKAFNTAINIMNDAPIHWGSCNTRYTLEGFDFEHLARWSSIFNEKNYNKRYAHHAPWQAHTYKFWRDWEEFVSRESLAQAITTLTCLKYNISDYYDEKPGYLVLVQLIEKLTAIFLETSPEMKAAEWR